jgi:proline-specific peptidase
VELFLDEVKTVREQLGLNRAHILGQSWGGMLAMEHALAGEGGIESLVLCDPLADTHQWVSEANRLRGQLPAEVQNTLLRHERAGTTGSPEYQAAMLVYYRRHVWRLDPWPEYLERTFAQLNLDPEVYNVLWGSSEFHVTGKLKDWSILSRVDRIKAPTLLMSGRYDEATPAIMSAIHERISGSEWRLFERSSHMPHAEERELFMEVLGEFLSKVERGPQA